MTVASNDSLPADTIANLLKEEVKPVFLLGAGASVRSGVPMSEHLVEAIAKWGYCKIHDRVFSDPTLMRSDWWPWLQQQHWFQHNHPLADQYPRAVESLLKPRANRKAFFQHILRPGVPPSPGYSAMARLLARKVIRTVLTTNFDQLLVEAARSVPEVHLIEEIRTNADFQLFSTNPRYPQVVYVHGSVDHYTDQNVEDETNRLNPALVELLRPLLRDHPLVVVGYRGAEPSVMRHHLIEQREACQSYRHGIYWCHLKGRRPPDSSALIYELAGITGNLQFVEIDGFDDLMALLDRALPDLVRSESFVENYGRAANVTTVYDLEPSSADFSDLNEVLLRSKLLAYADAVRLPRPDLSSSTNLGNAAVERSLAISVVGSYRPTNGGVLLFARKPEILPQQAKLEIRLSGPSVWVSEVLERPDNTTLSKSEIEDCVVLTGDLWTQLEKASDLLARVNRPFRLKGPTSQDAYRYPPLALKELLTNLLAHRDYLLCEPSVISITPQDIRFENPGGLVEHVRKQLDNQEIQSVVSADTRGIKGYRNPVIADFFFSAGAMDKEGSGLPDVLIEAANNLNKVQFGPTEDNDTFVAMIQCRPEALSIDTTSRTARSNAGELRYSPNLLTVSGWPEHVWKLATISEWRDFGYAEAHGAPPFTVNRNWVWTFADIHGPEFEPLKPYILEEEIHYLPTSELLGPDGPGLTLPRLFNIALTNYLVGLGLRPKQEGGRIRAYFPANNGQAREVSYRGLFKQATRTVAKPVVSRSTGRIIYWEHKAVSLRFERFGDVWCLSLVPCYVFTADGDRKPIESEKIGPLSTRRASRDYNPTVLHDMVFWTRILARGVEPSFDMPLAAVGAGVDGKSADKIPTVEITATLPTVAFQEPADANMGATVEAEMSEEELHKIQEAIEQAIEETNETYNDNGDQSSDH